MLQFESDLIKALRTIQEQQARPLKLPKKAGSMVYSSGEASDKLFLITSGVVELSRPLDDEMPLTSGPMRGQPRGQARVKVTVTKLGWVGPGGMVGELEFHARRDAQRQIYPKRYFNARAITDVQLLELPYTRLLEALPGQPIVEEQLRRHVVSWLDHMAETIGAARFQPMQVRLARVLRDLAIASAPSGPVAPTNRAVIALESCPPQDEIAIAVGEERETISRQMKQWERSGILRNGERQMLIITDFQRLSEIAQLGEATRRQGHDDSRMRIDTLLDRGDNYRARNLALQLVERTYPRSPEIQHRACIACARAGGAEEAMRLVVRFGFDADLATLWKTVGKGFANPLVRGARDREEDDSSEAWEDDQSILAERKKRLDQLIEDISVLAGRLAKDAAFAPGTKSNRQAFLRRAHQRYNEVYESTGRPFSGINAAAMAALLGDASEATRIAGLVQARLPPKIENYWQAATRAEASALLGFAQQAQLNMAAAAKMEDATPGRRASTRRQLTRLKGAVAQECLDAMLEALPVEVPIAYSGHMMLGDRMDKTAQASAAFNLGEKLKVKLAEARVGSAYGALAAGSDILIAEEVLRQRASLHVVLPTRPAEFVVASVNPGDPPGEPGHWRRRFDHCLAQAASVTILHEGAVGLTERDAVFQAGFRFAAGLALLQAEELVTRASMLAVYDGGPANNIAGTAMALRTWEATGEALHVLDCDWRQAGKGSDIVAKTPFRPVIFVWSEPDRVGKGAGQIRKAVEGVMGSDRPLLSKQTQDAVVALVCEGMAEAADLAIRLAQDLPNRGVTPRIICDFGLALDPNGQPSQARIAQMRGCKEMPEIPPGQVAATEGFAAEACLEKHCNHSFQPMGRVAVAAKDKASGMPLPSVRMFQVLPP
jgi:CRP-like cAMP-binding protein